MWKDEMMKMFIVAVVTAFAIMAADYLYRLSLPEGPQGSGAMAGEFVFVRASIPPNRTLNPWTGTLACHPLQTKKPNVRRSKASAPAAAMKRGSPRHCRRS
jgi:hypothetical protein